MSAFTEKQTTRIFIRNYIQDTSEIFSISSLVLMKISLMSFLCFPLLFVQLFFFFKFSKHSYLRNKKKITRWFVQKYEVYLLVEK